MRFRVTLATLMGLVMIAAVTFAALRRPTPLWASALFTLTVLLLSAAIVGALLRRGNARAIWTGAAVFGWIYLCFAFIVGSNSNGATPPPFLTKVLTDYLRQTQPVTGHEYITDGEPEGEDLARGYQVQEPTRIPDHFSYIPWTGPVLDWQSQRRIGHCLSAILFAALGAGVGRLFAAKESR